MNILFDSSQENMLIYKMYDVIDNDKYQFIFSDKTESIFKIEDAANYYVVTFKNKTDRPYVYKKENICLKKQKLELSLNEVKIGFGLDLAGYNNKLYIFFGEKYNVNKQISIDGKKTDCCKIFILDDNLYKIILNKNEYVLACLCNETETTVDFKKIGPNHFASIK